MSVLYKESEIIIQLLVWFLTAILHKKETKELITSLKAKHNAIRLNEGKINLYSCDENQQ
jgi:hypothetical protein